MRSPAPFTEIQRAEGTHVTQSQQELIFWEFPFLLCPNPRS